MLNDPRYIYIWVNPQEKSIAICVCGNDNKDAVKVLPKRECEIYSSELFSELGRLQENWCTDCTYRVEGIVLNSKKMAVFQLSDNAKCSDRLSKECCEG